MNTLFNMSEVKKDSPRMELIRKHDVQTHHCPDCEEPWLAIPMKAAREIGKPYASPEDDWSNPGGITASIGILLEDRHLVFFGQSQREVEDEAIARAMEFEGEEAS